GTNPSENVYSRGLGILLIRKSNILVLFMKKFIGAVLLGLFVVVAPLK
ncbi:MAG: hypothetical protein ACJAU1_001559, partial [Psychromonas sp.]